MQQHAQQQTNALSESFLATRALTEQLAKPLSPEDQSIQSMPDASPTKWHLAHTTWFFETFILLKHKPNYQPVNETYHTLFNSYYNSLGEQYPRPKRGLISRPSCQEVLSYRQQVTEHMQTLLEQTNNPAVLELTQVGINHEQQHQELLLTDIKHALWHNPLGPAYQPREINTKPTAQQTWQSFTQGIYAIGHNENTFCFDNETPVHQKHLENFKLSSRTVTNNEYVQFLEEGAYQNPLLWLSEGWTHCQTEQKAAPLYWRKNNHDEWQQFTLSGWQTLQPHEPVVHINYFEADAFATWAGCRLPTESEWEVAAKTQKQTTPLIDLSTPYFHPQAVATDNNNLQHLFGNVWEWTCSSYSPYPGFKPASGAVGEYNGKFMCNQYVLRGGSCVTPSGHIRPTYRNFFPTTACWQFSGLRLAKD